MAVKKVSKRKGIKKLAVKKTPVKGGEPAKRKPKPRERERPVERPWSPD
jgi:hypothetical protein